jgi:hypothetical protein
MFDVIFGHPELLPLWIILVGWVVKVLIPDAWRWLRDTIYPDHVKSRASEQKRQEDRDKRADEREARVIDAYSDQARASERLAGALTALDAHIERNQAITWAKVDQLMLQSSAQHVTVMTRLEALHMLQQAQGMDIARVFVILREHQPSLLVPAPLAPVAHTGE